VCKIPKVIETLQEVKNPPKGSHPYHPDGEEKEKKLEKKIRASKKKGKPVSVAAKKKAFFSCLGVLSYVTPTEKGN